MTRLTPDDITESALEQIEENTVKLRAELAAARAERDEEHALLAVSQATVSRLGADLAAAKQERDAAQKAMSYTSNQAHPEWTRAEKAEADLAAARPRRRDDVGLCARGVAMTEHQRERRDLQADLYAILRAEMSAREAEIRAERDAARADCTEAVRLRADLVAAQARLDALTAWANEDPKFINGNDSKYQAAVKMKAQAKELLRSHP